MTPQEIATRCGQLAKAAAQESVNSPSRETLERVACDLLKIKSQLASLSHHGGA